MLDNVITFCLIFCGIAKLCEYPVPQKVLSSGFNIPWWFLHESVITEMVKKYEFSVILSTFVSWHSSVKNFPYSISINLVSVWTCRTIFHHIIIHYFLPSLFILMFKLSSIWLVRVPSDWLLCLLTRLHHSLCTFWHKNIFQVHLVLFQFQTSTEQLLQGSLVPFSGKWYIEIKT